MDFFEFDFSSTSKVGLVGKEHLVPPRKHTSRCTKEHIVYFVLSGELNMLLNGEPLKLVSGDIFIFEKGIIQQPVDFDECEYYYIHFMDDNFTSYSCDISDYEKDLKNRNLNYTKSNIYSFERTDYLKAVLPVKITVEDKNSFLLLEEKFKKLNKELGMRTKSWTV